MSHKEKEKQMESAIKQKGEDATKYGEFISTFFNWISPEEQRNRVESLEKITNIKKEKKRDK